MTGYGEKQRNWIEKKNCRDISSNLTVETNESYTVYRYAIITSKRTNTHTYCNDVNCRSPWYSYSLLYRTTIESADIIVFSRFLIRPARAMTTLLLCTAKHHVCYNGICKTSSRALNFHAGTRDLHDMYRRQIETNPSKILAAFLKRTINDLSRLMKTNGWHTRDFLSV